MITKYFQKKNSDSIGAMASSLCLIHCAATPFIFIAQTCSAACCESAPIWWTTIDYIFLAVSFFAVYWSSNQSSKQWIKYGLWFNWILLCLLIFNEKIEFSPVPEGILYLPAIALFVLHLYNQKHCRCNNSQYCVSKK
ncbi:MerC domain-containing protein [Winogradskyella sp. PE311]|uniref:MerC domain-containing protein n=1 Tax=Winogradskyella sp. PE311 TaxID=3366943 RepID=UPI00398141E5